MSGRLTGLLNGLTARAEDVLGGEAVIRRRYTVPDTSAAVTLTATDRDTVGAADRLHRGTYVVTGPGPARWTVEIVVVETRALGPVGYAFAGAQSVDRGAGIAVKRTPTPTGSLFATDSDHTLIEADLTLGRIRVWTDRAHAAQAWPQNSCARP